MRLTYEKAMLAEEGGTAAEVEIEVGGWFGNRQVVKVNKSNTTGRVVSIGIMVKTHGRDQWGNESAGEPAERMQILNIERFAADAYRSPTDEEREAFKAETAKRKAEAKATTPKAPPLINPTDADAEKLQLLWNNKAAAEYAELLKEGRAYSNYKPTEIRRMTQAEYSARSKGNYGNCETIDVCDTGHRPRRWNGGYAVSPTSPIACKVRKAYGGGGFTRQADAVIILTDKPQKPLPLDWEKLFDAASQLAEAS